MDTVALRIAEFLNEPVRIWMVFSVLAVARLIMLLARIFREQNHAQTVATGMTARREKMHEDRIKKATYYPKFIRRKNRDME